MNITLPEPLAKRLDKVANKSAFIARAVAGRMAALEKAEFRRRLIKDYREAAHDPEYVKEELDLLDRFFRREWSETGGRAASRRIS